MNEERIPKKVLNIKVKRKCPRGILRPRQEQQVRKDVTQKEEHRKKLRRSCGKTEMDRGAVERQRWTEELWKDRDGQRSCGKTEVDRGAVERQRWTEELGCQMTHSKWKHPRKNNNLDILIIF
jgi:hypothetical protein